MTESKLGLPAQTRSSGSGAVALTLGGLTAAFGVASCCGLPFLLAGAGVGTAWLYGIALVAAPHRLLLMALASICLAGGAVLLWRQRRQAVCAPGSICSKPAVQSLVIIGLLIGSALLYLGYRYA
jgi:mercuric ion transport protein